MSEQFVEEILTDSGDENEDQPDDKILKTRNRNIKHLELDFCNIFHQAIGKLLNLDDGNNVMYLRRFFKFWYPETTSWCTILKSATQDKYFKHLLTCSLYYRVAYMYRIGVVLASATAFHFQNVLIENPNLCKVLLKKRNLKICSLGSGCPLDVVGVAKVLETVAKIMNIELEIFATVVDANGDWKNASMTALTGLEQFRGSTWKINFIQADVSAKKISPEIVKAIQESDIVTMVNMNTKNKITTILKNITDVIRSGSMMLILDSSRLPFIKSCGGQTGAINKFHLIYEELCQAYTLQESTVKRLFGLYHRNFPTFGCDRKLDVFVRVWTKPSDRSSEIVSSHLDNPFATSRENQNSLCTNNYFRNWEVRFAKEMAKYGWKRKGINRMISVHQEKRSRLLKQHNRLLNTKKETDLELDLEFSLSENEEEEWEDQYDAKRNLARVQLGVSKISIFNLRCSLKRSTGEPAKKKLAKKKPALCENTSRKMDNNLLHNSSVL